jgi:putative ABC transport system permease protein
MNVLESIRISWRAITGHKLRSTLTTLGVVIGIGSVITFFILGGAFTQNILGDIQADNQPIVQVTTQSQPQGGTGVRFISSPIYTESDVQTLEEIDGVEYVAPSGEVSIVQVGHDGETRVVDGDPRFTVEATTPERFESGAPYALDDGTPFSAPDEAVLNVQATTQFDDEIQAGEQITITDDTGTQRTLTVTGIVNETLPGPGGATVYLPFETHYNKTVEPSNSTATRAYEGIEIRATDIQTLESVKTAVADYLETGSDASTLKRDDHTIAVQTIQDRIDQFTGIVDQLTTFVGGIAALSLLVGSIGIANIMIVSVTERTREIGIMKAIGARKRDVIQLFLVESVILGGIGAVLGVGLGVGASYLVVRTAGWPMVYPLLEIGSAVAVGILVGVISGLYPAWRGARVDPIEALRRE